jgi:hypothetical protein
MRAKWATLINRQESETDRTPWQPKESSSVCSDHFKDGKPTDANPLPTLKLGYSVSFLGENVTARPRNAKHHEAASFFGQTESTTSRTTSKLFPATSTNTSTDDSKQFTVVPDLVAKPTPEPPYSDVEVHKKTLKSEPVQVIEHDEDNPVIRYNKLEKTYRILKGNYMAKCMTLKAKMQLLRTMTRPLSQQLLKKDGDAQFYTGLPTIATFKSVVKFVQAWQKLKEGKQTVRRLAYTLKLHKYKHLHPIPTRNIGKIPISEKILLVLMKLRLGLLHKDLADR